MAYNSIGKPRFYIDYLSYFLNEGLIHSVFVNSDSGNSLLGMPIGLDPATSATVTTFDNSSIANAVNIYIDFNEYINQRFFDNCDYIAILGHTLNTSIDALPEGTGAVRMNLQKRVNHGNPGVPGGQFWRGAVTSKHTMAAPDILNSEWGGTGNGVEHHTFLPKSGASIFQTEIASQINVNEDSDTLDPLTGFALAAEDGGVPWDLSTHGANTDRLMLDIKFRLEDGSDWYTPEYSGSWKINNISMGHIYDIPHSPDLALSMTIEYDGVDIKETTGGSTVTNLRYSGNPKWGTLNPWEVGASEGNVKRNGRRVWSLRFSYISDKDMFSSNYMTNPYLENSSQHDSEDVLESNELLYTIQDDDSIDAKLLNYIANGNKFIFQPDNLSNNPSDFAICMLDQRSLKITQKAHKAYSITMKIREVW